MRQSFFLQQQGRSRASERLRERREARFDRMREEQASKPRDIDSTNWHAETVRRLRAQQQRPR